jgi:radical SAM-linked protein
MSLTQHQKYPLRLTLNKHGNMIYFSQLDLVRILERALRRTELPVYFSQGFHPRVKISFYKNLKLGQKGQIELVLYFTEKIIPSILREKLSPTLPTGLEIISCQE